MANIKGGVIAAQQNAVAQKQEKPMVALVNKMMPEIKKALPSVLTPERFTRMVLSAISTTPKLAECEPKSFLGAMMQAAQLGVEPNTPLGQAYIIPYGKQAQFQLGFKGLIDLAYRSGEVTIIQAHEVHENDEFSYSFGLEPDLVHKPALHDRGEVIAYYAMFKTKSGGFSFHVMSKEDVLQHARQYSKTFNDGPWQTNFDEMAKKTVVKAALKYAPLKSDFVKGMAADETVKSELSADMLEVHGEEVNITEEATVVDTVTGEVIEPMS